MLARIRRAPLAAVHHRVHCRAFCRALGTISRAMHPEMRCGGKNGAAGTLRKNMYRPLPAVLVAVHSRVHCRVLCREKCPGARAKRAAMCARVYGRAAELRTAVRAARGSRGPCFRDVECSFPACIRPFSYPLQGGFRCFDRVEGRLTAAAVALPASGAAYHDRVPARIGAKRGRRWSEGTTLGVCNV